MPRLPTRQADALKKWLSSTVFKKQFASEPLPTTRELARRFDLSASTAFRALLALEREGTLWQSPQGRFYTPSARRMARNAHPFGCLVRKIEQWSLVYQSIMEGVSSACASRGIPLMLWGDHSLVTHENTARPPSFSPEKEQADLLQRFFSHGQKNLSGLLLDHLWSDGVLHRFSSKMQTAVLVYRNTGLPWLKSAALDFRQAAGLAIAHLFDRGYQKIIPVCPFLGDPGIDQMLGAIRVVAKKAGAVDRITAPVSVSTPLERQSFARRFTSSRHRVAILSPEDHIASLLWEEFRRQGFHIPRDVGLFSLQGTKALASYNISAARFDFRALGDAAVRLSLGEIDDFPCLPAVLSLGSTT